MVVTNVLENEETIRILRAHGVHNSYDYLCPGFNSRLDTLQAAVLRVKLRQLDRWITLRREKAALYSQLLSGLDGIEPPLAGAFGNPSFNYYTIRLKKAALNRNKLRKHLELRGIQAMVYYPLSLHLQEAFSHLGYQPGDFQDSEQAQEQVVSLSV